MHLDNYIFRNDATGERFAEALAAKAAEGVAVRVFYDWFRNMDVPRSFWKEPCEAGAEVRANPPTPGTPFGAIRREHRKLVAVDGEYASTGGVCTGDGWWSKVGSTNLNVSRPFVNLEIDLVAEDAGSATEVEALFEEDLSNAGEVRLIKAGQRRKVLPEHPIDSSNRGTRRGVAESGSGSASACLLGLSLLGARFPRLVAWPLTALGSLIGGLGVVRTSFSERASRQGPDRPQSGENCFSSEALKTSIRNEVQAR